MNENLIKLAKKSGFVFWQGEEWAPNSAIDWSSNYDKELGKFAEHILDTCVKICKEGENTQMTSTGAAERIKLHFGVE
jgi:hypothetical protein